MAGLIYYTDKRRVLPQLERTSTYIDTLNVASSQKGLKKSGLLVPIINLKDENLSDKIIAWKKSKNSNLAGDIISQALILNKTEGIEEVKKHLLSNFPSDNILNWLFEPKSKKLINDNDISHNYKKLKLEPKDSLTWTDQAINHLEANDRENAIKCIEEAIKINSNLGFIVRNASRIFSLTGDNGRSIKLLKNSEYYKYDPQILSAEIAFSQLENRKTIGIEIGQKLINELQYRNREKSELASTLGTVEYFKGEYKKSEQLFNLSLLEPNKNSLAQSLWYKKDSISVQKLNAYKDSNEIQTHLFSKENNFKKSLEYALKWKNDEPYSLRPYSVASHLCGTVLGDFEKAFELYKEGMESQKEIKGNNFSSKDEKEFNNDLAYNLLKANNIEAAEEYLKPSLDLQNKTAKLEDNEYINIATIGLLYYKQNHVDVGRRLYRMTIKYFFDVKKYYLAGSAFLNFFDEEINVIKDIESLHKLRRELDDIVPSNSQGDLLYRKDNSIQLFQKAVLKLK